MRNSLHAVFFDVDGVLLDSLPQHLQICRDEAREFGLQLTIPTVERLRVAISRGTKVSPMYDFFLAVGFPEKDAKRAVADYERDFMKKYRPTAFEGVDQMLRTLRKDGFKLGLVTSNTRENVIPALSDAIQYFEESGLFFFDGNTVSHAKSRSLTKGSKLLGIEPSNCIYVGDQPADALAARDAGFGFLGVTYGWGILKSESRFETVDSVFAIPQKILSMKTR